MSIERKNLKSYSASTPKGQASTPNMLGVWQNELGSTMTATNVSGQTFSGTYSSAVSEGGGSVTGPVAGTVSGDAVGFTVNWSSAFSSVTSWSGVLLTSGDGLVIYSLWQMANTPESEEDFWQSIQAGADLFFQVTPKK
jgi:hypothetical protein